jgi:type I restriction enzyme S subunit
MDGLDLTDILEMDFTPAERAVYELRPGDLVIAEASGSATHVGRAAVWRGELRLCCYQNTVIRFRPYAVLADYALIAFQHLASTGELARVARGIGILHLGAARFAKVRIALPPLAEQRRIVDAEEHRRGELREVEASLRSALNGIALQDREILAAAVAGELVEPEAAQSPALGSRATDATGTRAHEGEGDEDVSQTSLFDEQAGLNEAGSDTSMRSHPPGWNWVRVDQAGEVMIGRQREPSRHSGPNMRPYLRVANVQEDRIDTNDILQMHFTPDEAEAYALRYGDILLNEGQSPELVGRPAMFRDELPGACFQKTLLRFRPGPNVDPEYALLVFRHYLHAGDFRKLARWSTNIAHLTLQRFRSMPFPVPPLAQQRRIVTEGRRRLAESSSQRAAVEAALGRLPAMISELLSTAVSGRLVDQGLDDEPAAALLIRLGPPPTDTVPARQHELPAAQESATDVAGGTHANSLAAFLQAAGRSMSALELFKAAGYDRNDIGDIERFFVSLRTEINISIRTAGGVEGNPILEIIADAPQ